MPSDKTALRWTAADVLSDVRRKASIPDTSTDFSDTVILREATDVLWNFVGWSLSQAGEGRAIETLDRSVATSLLGGAYRAGSEVMLPPLAIADTIEAVSFVSADGAVQTRLARIPAAEESYFDTINSESATPSGYALLGGRLRLYPRPNAGGTLRITYQRRHPELIPDSQAFTIATASLATSSITLGLGAPHGLAVGDAVDIIRSAYPYAPVLTTVGVLSIPNANDVVLEAPSALVAGSPVVTSRLVRAGQAPYVSLPLEFRSAFSEKVAANCMRIIGDMTGAGASESVANTELARVIQMMSPRVKRDKPRAVNPHSLMRTRRY